ncbi:uncharacterized protein LOC117326892 [Pecten maximus]|uniref:uncharacterized protein LOC117326892 n=1 Tax=Pecten maximus TaxID=6579 RepID=UPI001457EE09|nr:uncharacterized protein LOC117326892 [Pecten maximus]
MGCLDARRIGRSGGERQVSQGINRRQVSETPRLPENLGTRTLLKQLIKDDMSLRIWNTKLRNLVKWLQRGVSRLHDITKDSRMRPKTRTSHICLSTNDEWYHDPISRTWSWLG